MNVLIFDIETVPDVALGRVLYNLQGLDDAEVAKANGHPEWKADIQSTFAKRWIAKADGGTWYQDGGAWKQK